MEPLILPNEGAYWILPGKFMAGGLIKKSSSQELLFELNKYRNCGINAFFNLTEETEIKNHSNNYLDYAKFLPEFNVYYNFNMKMYRFPVKDFSVPSVESMIKILNQLHELINSGNTVYLHCWGGIGRTGTVVGCFLKHYQFATTENVLEFIKYLRRTTEKANFRSPETDEQVNFVLNW